MFSDKKNELTSTMKKIISIFTLFILTALLFSACGNLNKIRFSPFSSTKSGFAPTKEKVMDLPINTAKKIRLKDAESCDSILLKTGEMILGAIQVTGKEKIIYVECDNQDGHDITIQTSALASITSSSGTFIEYEEKGNVKDIKRYSPSIIIQPDAKEVENNQDIQTEMNEEEHKEYLRNKKRAELTLIFGGLAFIPVIGFIFGIIAICIGSSVMKKSDQKPGHSEVYNDAKRGRRRAIIALSLGVSIFLVLIINLLIASRSW